MPLLPSALSLLTALSVWSGAPQAVEASSSRLGIASGDLRVGGQMKNFAGWTLAGDLWSSERHRKKNPRQVLVVSFFATWCDPCVRSLPTLDRLRASMPPEAVGVVLVAYGEEGDAVSPFAEKLGLGSLIVLDPYGKISARFGVDKSLPRTFVVDPAGKVRTIFEVEGADFDAVLRRAIDEASKPPRAAGGASTEVPPPTGGPAR